MENRPKNSAFRLPNSFINSSSGLITTFAQGGEEEDIRKSRIQHLPSYRKGDLSDKLQFVIVFQTIEIERLSVELQSLRVKLKDSDRQMRIYLNYEVQIKELTENSHQLQQQRRYYQNQVEQMSLACNSLYQQLNENKKIHEKEVEDLKRQFYKSQAQLQKVNKNQQQVIAKLQAQLLKKSQGQVNAQNKVKSLSQQLEKVNQSCCKNENEIVLLKERDLKKTQELRKTQKQLQQYQRQQQRVQDNLIEENRKLTNQVDKKKAQILAIASSWEKDNKVLDNSKRQLQFLKKQNQNIKGRLQQLQNQHNRKLNDLVQSENTNEELKSQLKINSIDFGKQKDKYLEMNVLANELKVKIQSKSKQVENFKKYLINFQQQCQKNTKKQAELTRKIAELEPVLAQNNSLQEKMFQIANKFSEKELQINGKQRTIIDLTIQNKQLTHARKQLSVRLQRNEKQLKQFEEQMQTQRKQNEREKKQLINESQQKIDKLVQEKKLLSNQKERIERDVEKLKSEGLVKEDMKLQIKRLSENCKRQEKDIQIMNNRLQNIGNLIVRLKEKNSQFNEIEKTNSLLKKQLDSSFTLIDKMIQKIGGYEQQIENLTDQNWRLTDRLKQEYYKDEYFSTSSSAKTIQSQYNTPTSLINSTRFSSFHQNKPFEPFGYGQLQHIIPFANLSASNVKQSFNAFRQRQTENSRVLQASNLQSRQSYVYSSMIGKQSNRNSYDSQNSWDRR